MDVSQTGIPITSVDMYCAFAASVQWWFETIIVRSPVVRSPPINVAPSAGNGFYPGYPTLVVSTITTSSVEVHVYLYPDTRSPKPNVACHAIAKGVGMCRTVVRCYVSRMCVCVCVCPLGSPSTYDSFGMPTSPVFGMFGEAFAPGVLISGVVNTGVELISNTNIFCTYFDFYANEWIVAGPLLPSTLFRCVFILDIVTHASCLRRRWSFSRISCHSNEFDIVE